MSHGVEPCWWRMTTPSLRSQIAEIVKPDTRIVSGKAELPDWEWVPEVDLPERYGRAERVVVVDGNHEIAPVRVWLPRANGATAWGVVAGEATADLEDVAVALDAIGAIDWNVPTPLVEHVDARFVASAFSNRDPGPGCDLDEWKALGAAAIHQFVRDMCQRHYPLRARTRLGKFAD